MGTPMNKGDFETVTNAEPTWDDVEPVRKTRTKRDIGAFTAGCLEWGWFSSKAFPKSQPKLYAYRFMKERYELLVLNTAKKGSWKESTLKSENESFDWVSFLSEGYLSVGKVMRPKAARKGKT